MSEGYILDTNILIYLSRGDEKVAKTLSRLNQEWFFISIISHFEFLNGHKTHKHFKELEEILVGLAPIDLNCEISKKAALLDRETDRKIKFKDLIIAATALVEGLTLVTADKGFKKIKGLKLKFISFN